MENLAFNWCRILYLNPSTNLRDAFLTYSMIEKPPKGPQTNNSPTENTPSGHSIFPKRPFQIQPNYCFFRYNGIMNEAYLPFISVDPEIRFGKPCIVGTRIAIVDILQMMANGLSHEEILDEFPVLLPVHLQAALQFAAYREQIIKAIAQ